MITIKEMKHSKSIASIHELKPGESYSLKRLTAKGTIYARPQSLMNDISCDIILVYGSNYGRMLYYKNISQTPRSLKDYRKQANLYPWWLQLKYLKFPSSLKIMGRNMSYANIQLHCNGILFNDWDPD